MALQSPLLSVLLGLAGALHGATPEVWQSPPYTIAPEKGSISITCSTREPLLGVYLKQSHWPKLANVVYYEDGKEPTVDERFKGRVTFSGSQHNLTISMHHLQPADTGTYVCQAIVQDEVWGPGTLVVVTDTCQETRPTHFTFLVVLAMSFFYIGVGLGALCVLMKTKIKKLCQRKDESQACVVYEDMSCSRRSNVSSSNLYH
ncbi:T-cell antigen CD7 [Pteropus medius]|uniref:T-cell antigen CD7 n=1 Tax=Pteropus vampyrus TaxID=132908 RepID=A0A6P3RCV4_PTEVA|nr:T-cell antigen CD7 [Pteropus vampyrus]XP_039715403.1 T-cell antigen CD7 [Pteropus giganteus]